MDVDNLHVLAIEPDLGWSLRLAEHFAGAGWDVDVAATMEQLGSLSVRHEYDVAVLGPTLSNDPAAFQQARLALPTLPLVAFDGPSVRHVRSHEILERLPDPVMSFDVTDRGPVLVTANAAVGTFLGLATRELLAAPERLWGHLLPDEQAELQGALETGAPDGLVLSWTTESGRVVVTDATITLRTTAGGQLASDLHLRDATERLRLQRVIADRDEQLRGLAAQTGEAVFHLRLWPRLGFVFANDAVVDVLGLTSEQLMSDAAALFHAVLEEDLPVLERAMQEAVGGATVARFRLRRPDGEVIAVEVSLRPLRGEPNEPVVLLGSATAVALDSVVTPVQASEADEGPRIEEVDVLAVAAAAVSAIDLGDRTVAFRGEQVRLTVDVQALEMAIAESLDNVRRHTPVGTSVEVTVAKAMSGALLAIRDDGPGITWPRGWVAGRHGLVEASRLAAVEGLGGNGARTFEDVASQHAGRATIQSVEGEGTTVRILLHTAVAAAAAPDDEPETVDVTTTDLVSAP